MFVQVKRIVAEVCWLNPEDIEDDRDLIEYGLDSSRSMDLVVALEEQFGVEIPDDALVELRTVSDIVALIRSQVAA